MMLKRYSLAAIAVAVITQSFLVRSHAQTQPTSPEALTISIDLTGKDITENGISIRQHNIKPLNVTVGKESYSHWAATQGSAGQNHLRSFYFTVTDARFREGRMPVLDMEVEFRQPADVPVFVTMDTANGSREIGRTRGRTPEIKTLKIRVDDAFLGARTFGSDPKTMPSDGYDFRINSMNTDLELRRVTIRGYDLDHNIDTTRLLRAEGISTPNDVFAFQQNQEQTLTYQFKNLSRKEMDLRARFALTDFTGNTIATSDKHLKISGQTIGTTDYLFKTGNLPLGIYPLKLMVLTANGDTVYERESYLSVMSPEQLSKAKEGEFLYGLDVAMGLIHNRPRLMKWIDLMGVDIVRAGGLTTETMSEAATIIPALDAAHLRVMPMYDPPKTTDEKQRVEQLARAVEILENTARRFPQLQYWELGNEPDLTFFYPGNVDHYVADFAQMSQAIKRGNPNAFIMNGGLAYVEHRPESAQRVERIVQLMDPAALDGWAYHGHGPSDVSERQAYARMNKILEKYGKAGKPLVETESGLAARTRPQELAQAATAVQKMVFAQSVKMPLFIWFRLFFLSEDYYCLVTDQEARPSVLSYRNMVQQLRGLAYSQPIQLSQSELQAHLFAQDTKRCIVAWSADPITHNTTFNLGRDAASAKDIALVDLFGNTTPLQITQEGSVNIPVGPLPAYLRWVTADPSFAVTQGRSVLQTPPQVTLTPNVPTSVSLTLHNPSEQLVHAALRIKPKSQQTVIASPEAMTMQLAPHTEKQVEIHLTQSEDSVAIQWPEAYKVFVDVDDSRIDLSQTELPQTLSGFNGPVTPQTFATLDGNFNFEKLGGKRREKACAIVFAEIVAQSDTTIRVGGSSDWWMQWFLNGKPIFDTLDRGNGGRTGFTDHIIELPLKKGRNLLAIRQLSGKDGWSLAIGNPTMLAAALSRQAGHEIVEATLEMDGKPATTERIPLQFRRNLAGADGLSLSSTLGDLQSRIPLVILEDVPVNNFLVKEPDSSKWYKGNVDLSARAWAFRSGSQLLTFVAVRDNTSIPLGPPTSTEQHQTGDYVRFALATDRGVTNDVIVGSRDGQPVLICKIGETKSTQISVTQGKQIALYAISIPLPSHSATFKFNFVVGDDDGYGAKQILQWSEGLDPIFTPQTWPTYPVKSN